MSAELDKLLEQLTAERKRQVDEIETGFSEISEAVKSAFEHRAQNNHAEARKLLNAALDIECELTGDCAVLGDLAEDWGVDFEGDR